MTDRLAILEAKQAIRDALSRYCRAMDRIDAELGYDVWHPDGTAHYSGIYVGTGRGFIDWVCDLHRGMVATSHQVTNVLVEIAPDGRHAASEAYVSVRLRTASPDGALVDIIGAGRYLDRWSCRDGVWAIDHREYVSDLSTTAPVPQPLASVPRGGAEVIASRPDRTDASYALFGSLT